MGGEKVQILADQRCMQPKNRGITYVASRCSDSAAKWENVVTFWVKDRKIESIQIIKKVEWEGEVKAFWEVINLQQTKTWIRIVNCKTQWNSWRVDNLEIEFEDWTSVPGKISTKNSNFCENGFWRVRLNWKLFEKEINLIQSPNRPINRSNQRRGLENQLIHS